MPDSTAVRMRRRREREREGRWVVQIEIWPDLVDALETAGFASAGIETREAAAEAIKAMLLRWEIGMDRLRPNDQGVTRHGDDPPAVVDHANRKGDDHDADENP